MRLASSLSSQSINSMNRAVKVAGVHTSVPSVNVSTAPYINWILFMWRRESFFLRVVFEPSVLACRFFVRFSITSVSLIVVSSPADEDDGVWETVCEELGGGRWWAEAISSNSWASVDNAVVIFSSIEAAACRTNLWVAGTKVIVVWMQGARSLPMSAKSWNPAPAVPFSSSHIAEAICG